MVQDVAPEEIAERVENGDAPQIVDVRNPMQFQQAHIPGAENVPISALPRRVDEIDWDEEIVVSCAIGQTSQKAARMLESYEGIDADTDVYNLEGGLRAWEGDVASGREENGDEAGTSSSDEGPSATPGDAPF